MNMIKLQGLKGFRDFLPSQARKRQYVIDTFKRVFESYGFEPLETPALEYEEILLGKYGGEGDKLMYRFVDNGKRKVALRYDQTVPLARVVAQYQNQLPLPFKRYQIQPVWRAENTQKGRFREFLQCDIDTVGVSSPLSDAEIIEVAAKSLEKLGFKDFRIRINDRKTFQDIDKKAITILDKLNKIGEENVKKELINKKIVTNLSEATLLLDRIRASKPTQYLQEILTTINALGVESSLCVYSPTLARGLDYYTGMIFEIEIEGYSSGSVCGGGRYDKLIGMFAAKNIPAVGCAFGFDRIIEAMDELKVFPVDLVTTKVLVTIFSKDLKEKSLEAASYLRLKNINTEIYLDENSSLEKQLKYADKKQIPYVAIIGPEEASRNQVTLRSMKTRAQETLSIEDTPKKII